MTTADPRIEDLTRLRAWYARRGPRDGRAGVTPDGKIAPAIRWSVTSVLADIDAAMRLGKEDHARWRAGMGLDEPVEATAKVTSWSDQCPSREPMLTHARTRHDPAGVCVHCQTRIR